MPSFRKKLFTARPMHSQQLYEIISNDDTRVATYNPLFFEFRFDIKGNPEYTIEQLKSLSPENRKVLALSTEEVHDLITLCTNLDLLPFVGNVNGSSIKPKSGSGISNHALNKNLSQLQIKTPIPQKEVNLLKKNNKHPYRKQEVYRVIEKNKKLCTEPEVRSKYNNIKGRNYFHIFFFYEINGINTPVKLSCNEINLIEDMKERKKQAELLRVETAQRLFRGWNPFDRNSKL